MIVIDVFAIFCRFLLLSGLLAGNKTHLASLSFALELADAKRHISHADLNCLPLYKVLYY